MGCCTSGRKDDKKGTYYSTTSNKIEVDYNNDDFASELRKEK